MILIISKQLKSGLVGDAEVIALALPNYRCMKIDHTADSKKVNDYKSGQYGDIYAKIFLEHIIPEWLDVKTQLTLFMPNPELLTDWDVKNMDKMDKIICKTNYVFGMMPQNKIYTKMSSLCNKNTAIKDYDMCLHLAGTSYMKGTRPLLETWVANNGFLDVNPRAHLVITFNVPLAFDQHGVMKYWKSLKPVTKTINIGRKLICENYGNIFMVNHLNAGDFAYFSKKAGIRIQPSITEGYGHCINEGRCTKSIVLTTDFPPMNELITDPRFLIAIERKESSYNMFKDFKNLSRYIYHGKAEIAHVDKKDFAAKIRGVLSMDAKEKTRVAGENFKEYNNDTKYFNAAMKKLVKKPTRGGSDKKDFAAEVHKKYPGLRINQPTMKRTITVISDNFNLISEVNKMRDLFDIKHETKLPAFNTPNFITITDIKLELDMPSAYTIFYNRGQGLPSIYQYITIADDGKTTPGISFTHTYNTTDLRQICTDLTTYLVDLEQKIELYNVGEHHFTKKKPTPATHNYDDSYDFWVYANDKLVKGDAVKGIPYEKLMTACISSFIPIDTVVLDVGTNIGTVSLPLSRLHGSNIKVVSFEAFKSTYSVFARNVIQNNAFNTTPILVAAGDIKRQNISLSDEIVMEDYQLKTTETLNMNNDNEELNYGAVHIGTGSNTVNMVRIDDLKLNISAMKVDVEGAEPLVFYGARETIRRCMPVIVFEKNSNVVSQDMINLLGLSEEVAGFNIVNYCRSLGYKKIYELHIDDYMLVPPGRNQLITNSIAKFKPFNRFKRFTNAELTGYQMFKLILPKW